MSGASRWEAAKESIMNPPSAGTTAPVPLSERVGDLLPLGHRALVAAWAALAPQIPDSDRKATVATRLADMHKECTAPGSRSKLNSAADRRLADEAILRLAIWLEGREAEPETSAPTLPQGITVDTSQANDPTPVVIRVDLRTLPQGDDARGSMLGGRTLARVEIIGADGRCGWAHVVVQDSTQVVLNVVNRKRDTRRAIRIHPWQEGK